MSHVSVLFFNRKVFFFFSLIAPFSVLFIDISQDLTINVSSEVQIFNYFSPLNFFQITYLSGLIWIVNLDTIYAEGFFFIITKKGGKLYFFLNYSPYYKNSFYIKLAQV